MREVKIEDMSDKVRKSYTAMLKNPEERKMLEILAGIEKDNPTGEQILEQNKINPTIHEINTCMKVLEFFGPRWYRNLATLQSSYECIGILNVLRGMARTAECVLKAEAEGKI